MKRRVNNHTKAWMRRKWDRYGGFIVMTGIILAIFSFAVLPWALFLFVDPPPDEHTGVVKDVAYQTRLTWIDHKEWTIVKFEDGVIIKFPGTIQALKTGQAYTFQWTKRRVVSVRPASSILWVPRIPECICNPPKFLIVRNKR